MFYYLNIYMLYFPDYVCFIFLTIPELTVGFLREGS